MGKAPMENKKVGAGILILLVAGILWWSKKAEAVPAKVAVPEAVVEVPGVKLGIPVELSLAEKQAITSFREAYQAQKMAEPGAIWIPITSMTFTETGVAFTGGAYDIFYDKGTVMYDSVVHQHESLMKDGIYRSEAWWMDQEALARAEKPQALYVALISDTPPKTEAEASQIEAKGAEAYQEAGGYTEEYFKKVGVAIEEVPAAPVEEEAVLAIEQAVNQAVEAAAGAKEAADAHNWDEAIAQAKIATEAAKEAEKAAGVVIPSPVPNLSLVDYNASMVYGASMQAAAAAATSPSGYASGGYEYAADFGYGVGVF